VQERQADAHRRDDIALLVLVGLQRSGHWVQKP
jgi:hypothetical protein